MVKLSTEEHIARAIALIEQYKKKIHNDAAKFRLIQEILKRPWSKKTKLDYLQLVLDDVMLPKDAKI
jgi:hypothetical protein